MSVQGLLAALQTAGHRQAVLYGEVYGQGTYSISALLESISTIEMERESE